MELDEPMDINLVRRPSNDITTAECRINNVIIDKAVLDGGAQSTMMSRKLARRVGLKIDTSNPLSLEGVSTDSKSYGWCYNVPITFTNKSFLNQKSMMSYQLMRSTIQLVMQITLPMMTYMMKLMIAGKH